MQCRTFNAPPDHTQVDSGASAHHFTLVLLGTASRLLLSLTVKPRLHYMRLYHIPWGTLAQEIVTSIMRLLTWEHARRSVQHGRPLVQSDGGHHRLCTGMGKSHA